MEYRILVINFGSTSSKIAIYEDEIEIESKNISYTREELDSPEGLFGQLLLRQRDVETFVRQFGVEERRLSAIVARAGATKPVDAGAYIIEENMLDSIKNRPLVAHPSNLTPFVAYALGKKWNVPCYIYDSMFDQMEPVAKITGMPDIKRTHMGHVENMRACAFKAAKELGKTLSDCNFIITHLGGGITQGVMKQGRLIDFNDSSNSPFSPERAGVLPARQLAKLIYSGKYTEAEMMKKISGKGGIYAYLGTADCREVEKRIANGDEQAKLIYDAMIYQIAKGIGAFAAVLEGNIDAVILAGGIAHSDYVSNGLRQKCSFFAPFILYPGEFEMESMASGVLRVLRGEEEAKVYPENW